MREAKVQRMTQGRKSLLDTSTVRAKGIERTSAFTRRHRVPYPCFLSTASGLPSPVRYGALFIHNEEFRKITLFLMLLLRLFVLFTCHNNLH